MKHNTTHNSSHYSWHGRRSRRLSLAGLALAAVALAHGVAHAAPSTAFTFTNNTATPGGVTTDAFDFSQGARVYAALTTMGNHDSARDILGASTAANYGPGSTIFENGVNRTNNLYFRTASLMTLTRYELRINADLNGDRDLNFVRLRGSADNVTWTDFGSTAVVNPFTGIPGVTQGNILITGVVTDATPAQFFRLEVRNGDTGITGVRVVELDGFGTALKSWAGGLVRDPVLFNAADNGPANHVCDQDPGYVVDITSSVLYGGENAREAFGAFNGSGAEEGTLIFGYGVLDNGNQIMGDFSETIHWLQWKISTNLPAPLAGVSLGITGVTDRWVELIRFSIDGSAVTFTNGATIWDHGGVSGALNLMFQQPRSIAAGATFKLEMTSGQGNGPRLSEVDAWFLCPPIFPEATVITIR